MDTLTNHYHDRNILEILGNLIIGNSSSISDNHGNHKFRNEIFCANGEVVDLRGSEEASLMRFIEGHGVEIGEDTGVYTLGEFTSPLQSRCVDALQEHAR